MNLVDLPRIPTVVHPRKSSKIYSRFFEENRLEIFAGNITRSPMLICPVFFQPFSYEFFQKNNQWFLLEMASNIPSGVLPRNLLKNFRDFSSVANRSMKVSVSFSKFHLRFRTTLSIFFTIQYFVQSYLIFCKECL